MPRYAVYKFRADADGNADKILLPSAGIFTNHTCIDNGNPTHGGASCVTGHDCNNNGGCDGLSHTCVCKPGYRGDKCQFAPTCSKWLDITLMVAITELT